MANFWKCQNWPINWVRVHNHLHNHHNHQDSVPPIFDQLPLIGSSWKFIFLLFLSFSIWAGHSLSKIFIFNGTLFKRACMDLEKFQRFISSDLTKNTASELLYDNGRIIFRFRKSRYIHNQKAFGFRKSSTLSVKEWALKVSISEKETTLMSPESVYIRKRDDPNGPWKCWYQKKGRPIATPSSLLWGKWGEKLSPKVICRNTLGFEISWFLNYFKIVY